MLTPSISLSPSHDRSRAHALLAGLVLVVTTSVLSGCPDPVSPIPVRDAGDGTVADAGSPEPVDAGTNDAGLSPDAGVDDAGAIDAGANDAGNDGGLIDGGVVAIDAGVDGGTNDGGVVDDAGADAGIVDAGPPMNACVVQADGPDFQISQKAQLRWKRDRVLERDLMAAMALPQNLVCAELGAPICFSDIHRVSLGGHEPVKLSMYKGIEAPGVTTPMSFDRVVISACGARVDLDALQHEADVTQGFGSAVLYRHYRLDAASVSSQSVGVREQITDLYHAILARDPTNDEVRRVATLANPDPNDADNGDAPSARDFSKMACYAVASSAEFLFQ